MMSLPDIKLNYTFADADSGQDWVVSVQYKNTCICIIKKKIKIYLFNIFIYSILNYWINFSSEWRKA